MNKKLVIFIGTIFIFILSANGADLRLPSILGNHMLLQQKSDVTIWGWAEAGVTVSVKASWLDSACLTKVNDKGKWKLNIPTPEAGGPYEMIISADTTLLLKDILIGEVWVCSGQSNMEMPVKGFMSQPVYGSNDCIANSDNPNIRLFKVTKKMSTSPLEDCEGEWIVSNPVDVAEFSAAGYFFGRYLQRILKVPVGLIESCWGGTKAEAWTDEVTLKNQFKEFDLGQLKSGKVTKNSPTVLFNGMINPILNYKIKGIVWYQGEGNRKKPEQYARLFPSMIKNWRDLWKQGEFPFYFVQIAPYKYDSTVNSAFLREAQLKTMLNTHNTGMVVTMDIGNFTTIHPPDKLLVGKRLAYWALAKTYGMEGLPYCSPIFKTMEEKGNKATLSFDYADLGLSSFGKPLDGFQVAGKDKVFHPANALIVRSNVIVWSDDVETPVAVRYCWENYKMGTLFNTAGLPAPSFRTDDWNE